MAFNSKSNMIDYNMSVSSTGGMKNSSCRNHIWMMNVIKHDQLTTVRKPPLMLQQYDYSL